MHQADDGILGMVAGEAGVLHIEYLVFMNYNVFLAIIMKMCSRIEQSQYKHGKAGDASGDSVTQKRL